ncbi:MBL fold metallo-hydrolase [Bradyrhizobium sp. HKCCYLS20291]|uniref:MBL fold metallo-hydrolase n=1 Tax=Bradyrhizobium sp. HKCCYLS20291 TaxID=3420766 RepID=UPI003EBD3FAF
MLASGRTKNDIMTFNRRSEMPYCLTRRDAGRLVVGAVAALAAWPSSSQAFKRFALGASDLAVISDGYLELPAAFSFPNVPEAERSAVLAANKLSLDTLKPDCNVTLLRAGQRIVLFDVGSGAHFMRSAGKLLGNLQESGIDPVSITDVVFTHGHPDHLWGLTDEFDELVFPAATYRMNEAEWNYWLDPDTLGKAPEDRKAFVVGAKKRLPLINDRLKLFKAGAEILPGIEAIGTPGHTPGHTSFLLHHGSDPVLVAGDVLSSTISFTNPHWHGGTDHDPTMAVQTRKRLLDRIANDKVRIVGFHLPHPGDGIAKAEGAAYRFLPLG